MFSQKKLRLIAIIGTVLLCLALGNMLFVSIAELRLDTNALFNIYTGNVFLRRCFIIILCIWGLVDLITGFKKGQTGRGIRVLRVVVLVLAIAATIRLLSSIYLFIRIRDITLWLLILVETVLTIGLSISLNTLKLEQLPKKRYKLYYKADIWGGAYPAIPRWHRLVHCLVDAMVFSYAAQLIWTDINLFVVLANGDFTPHNPLLEAQTKLVFVFILYGLCEGYLRQTPGKAILGNRVYIDEKAQAVLYTFLFRTLARFTPLEGISIIDKDKRMWHDTWSKTMVLPMDLTENKPDYINDSHPDILDAPL